MADYDLASEAFFANPTPTLNRLRTEAPVHWHEPLAAWVLTRYSDIADVLRSADYSVDRGGSIGRSQDAGVAAELEDCNRFFGGWMVFADGDLHGRLRQRVAHSFTPQSTRELRQIVERETTRLLDRGLIRPDGFDAIHDFAVPLSDQVTAGLVGLPPAAVPRVRGWIDVFFEFFGRGYCDGALVRRVKSELDEARNWFEELLSMSRDQPTGGLVDSLLEPEGPSGAVLSFDERLGLVMTLVAGALGTTSRLVGHAIVALLTRPEQWQLVCRDSALVRSAVEETFRHDGPALAVQRRARHNVVVGGIDIRKGDRVYCMLHAANHDPDVFEEPGRFDVRRDARRHLGLGFGEHFCIGASLARMEADVMLRALATRAPEIALGTQTIVREGNFAMRGIANLPVRAHRPETVTYQT